MLKRLISIFLLFIMITSPVIAEENIKIISEITHDFNLSAKPEYVVLRTKEDINLEDGTIIPQNTLLTAEVMEAQKERRWHKSGFIVCKLNTYLVNEESETVDISDKNIYLIAKKYEAVNKKDAAILTSELVLTQAASIVGSCFIIFAPVDIVYFFTKGAITKEKDPNWFKSGVSCAYDNSICWFWLKGKPIDLKENDSVKLKSVKEKRALKLTKQIEKRNAKQAIKDKKKQAKLEQKQIKKKAKAKI